MDRVRLFNRAGQGLCDLRVTVERTWANSSEGEAEFDIVYSDPNCREDYLRFGNWLLVENDKLPPWVGMIDVPRQWKRRLVHVHAYTPDHLFMYRDVPKQLLVNGKSGHIFAEVVNLVNRPECTIITQGDIWIGGNGVNGEKLAGDNMQDYLNSLLTKCNGEFWFSHSVSNGNLQIYANWRRKGVEVVNFLLSESYNLADADNTLVEQDEFYNELWGYGNGSSTSDRPIAEIEDPESIGIYGLRQGTQMYSQYSDKGSVEDALKSRINDTRFPRKTFEFAITDTGDTWSMVEPGKNYPLMMWSTGFGINTVVKVSSMYYDPFRGKVDLVTNEVVDDSQG